MRLVNVGSQSLSQERRIATKAHRRQTGSRANHGTTDESAAVASGIVATVDGQRNQIIYFNDDSTCTVMSLTSG
jgi:hypothetical protein